MLANAIRKLFIEQARFTEQAIAQASLERAGLICFPECFVPSFRTIRSNGVRRTELARARVSDTLDDFGKGGSNIARKVIRFSIRWKFPTLNVCLKLGKGGADL